MFGEKIVAESSSAAFFLMNCNHFLATVLSQVAIREFVPLTGIILFQKMCWHTLK